MTEDVKILQSGQVRVFIQPDGSSPANPYYYYGCLALNSPEQDLGTPELVYCPSPAARNQFDVIDSVDKPSALGKSDFTQRMSRELTDIWWDLKRRRCKFNMQAVISSCARPDDFTQWIAKIAFDGTQLTNFKLPDLNVLTPDDNKPVDLSGSLSFENWYPIKTVKFGEVAASVVVAEVLDGLYHDVIGCGECGSSDGCQKLYWLTTANPGSPGLSSQIVYSLTGGATWATIDIAALGGLAGNRVAAVGSRLVVVSEAYGGHLHETFDEVDAGTSAFVGVTTGYVAGKSPRAIYSKSTNETYIAASGGYIYFLVDPTGGVTVLSDGSVSTQNLNDIHGFSRTVVAVGASNAIQKSDNAGDTWALVVGPTPGVNLTAVWCQSALTWFVGTGNGRLYYTTNAGTTWTQIAFVTGASVINDIKFYNATIGYLVVEIGGAGRVYRTTDGGHSWQYQSPAVISVPTALRFNAVAVCEQNTLAVGGIKTVGGDGIIAVATA